MDTDKIIMFVNKVGLMPAGLMWLAWEVHRMVDRIVETQTAIVTNQQQALYLMQRLLDLHK
jgi:hypothetical protein